MPWGLIAVLAAYAVAVLVYVKVQYWDDPRYVAAQDYARALAILGRDDGRRCSEAELVEAMKLVLNAARLVPDEKSLAEHTEQLRYRFEERHFTIPPELVQHAELVSATALRRAQAKEPWLVVGARDRGWGPEQLLAGPKKAVLWAIPGGVLIIVVWAWGQYNGRALRRREHEAELKKAESDVQALGQFREGLGEAPRRYGEDGAPAPPAPRPRPQSSGGRPGVQTSGRPVRRTGVGAKSGSRPAVKKPPRDD